MNTRIEMKNITANFNDHLDLDFNKYVTDITNKKIIPNEDPENNIDNIEDLDGDEDKQNWLQTTLDKISSKLLLFSKMKEAS